ncbi:helix-turn-helix transcriptional regulator [Phormidium tenue FACHB-886]|nr:helix-turn-helix transcriptional regulator [Phormidium tenue FACHB-886]
MNEERCQTYLNQLKELPTFSSCEKFIWFSRCIQDYRRATETSRAEPTVSRVFEIIERRYSKKFGLREVAEEVGCRKDYLTYSVRRLTGKPVQKWIIERRLIEAGMLLLTTSDSIETIALTVGYQYTHHFHCQFREFYGMRPGAWRRLR